MSLSTAIAIFGQVLSIVTCGSLTLHTGENPHRGDSPDVGATTLLSYIAYK